MAWAIDNQDKPYVDFQRRIQSSIHYAKGKYKDYWDNPKNMEQHKKSQALCKENNKLKFKENAKKYNCEIKVAHDLFKEGKLSDKSNTSINKEVKKRLK